MGREAGQTSRRVHRRRKRASFSSDQFPDEEEMTKGEIEKECNNNVRISIDMEKENAEVPSLTDMVSSLEKKMGELSLLTPDHCIYTVPQQLRVKNPAAYTPKIVSIGPIHHGRIGLEAMEEYKLRYLQLFLDRVNIGMKQYADFVKGREERLRQCYADTIYLMSNDFIKIMMVDSAFVYEMLVRVCSEGDDSCRIFNRPFLVMNVIEDLMLLENQIPLFILEDLFNIDEKAKSAPQPMSSIRSDDRVDSVDILLSHRGVDASRRGEGQKDSGLSSLDLEDASKLEERRKSDISLNLDKQYEPHCCAGILRPLSQWLKLNSKPAFPICPPPRPRVDSFMGLVCRFVNCRPDIGTGWFNFDQVCSTKVVHLLDCLRRCHLSPRQLSGPPPSENKTMCRVSGPCSPGYPGSCRHLSSPGELYSLSSEPENVGHVILRCLRRCLPPCSKPAPPREADWPFNLLVLVPTITTLHQSGVRFAMNTQSTHLLDIKFDRRQGILKIPHFFMGDSTETVFRNLLAFEQCHYMREPLFADYFMLLDQLISEPSDVDLLVQSGVLKNTLGDSARAANIMNNIAQGLRMAPQPYFDGLCRELTEYYKVPWHKWKATLRQDYFNNPWAGISVIAAVILLVLTVVQTVYAIISK